jgi:ABC-type Mn2+/Zn2+ transport system ATPase subunit
MDLLEAEARAGKTVVATTHDLACAAHRFSDVLALNRRLVASGPASLVLDRDVLAKTYGGHLLVLDGQTVLIDDPHHHDEAPGGDVHHHEDRGR